MSGSRVVEPEPCGRCGATEGVRLFRGAWRCPECRDADRDALTGPL